MTLQKIVNFWIYHNMYKNYLGMFKLIYYVNYFNIFVLLGTKLNCQDDILARKLSIHQGGV